MKNKLILTMFAGLGMGMLSCSKTQTNTVAANDPKSPEIVQQPGHTPYHYSSEATALTEKMKECLGLTTEQEVIIKKINDERAIKIIETREKKNLTDNARLDEIDLINEWASEKYRTVLTHKQYDQFLTMIGEGEDFNTPTAKEEFKIIEEKSKSPDSDKASDYELQLEE